ncbi:MAG: 5'/3'-nucleotidase SurE [Candidatus Riflebacteria bacterium]|nr:5'/3'-nucleotidase SurE [Candidatus Riflebacteria bacterium]
MKLLLTNDDGISAKGLAALASAFAHSSDVWVVAPHTERSACSHSLTLDHPLRIRPVDFSVDVKKAFQVNSTPADCVKVALSEILDFRPDFILSGINRGANLSIDVFYSGTVAAAFEGAFRGIPAIAFSLAAYEPEGDYSQVKGWIKEIVERTSKHLPPPGTILNVNFPPLPVEKIKGVKITENARIDCNENFFKRSDPHGGTYFWRSIGSQVTDIGPNSDLQAIRDGWISISPLKAEWSDHETIKTLRKTHVWN